MNKWRVLVSIASLTLLLNACGTKEADKSKETKTEQSEKATNSAAFPMTVSPLTAADESEDGKKIAFEDVVFKEQPKRIVVLDYGFLDTLDALGVEGIVGVPSEGGSGNMPEAIKDKYQASDKIKDVGNLKELNLETIAEAKPDVIFLSGRQSPYYEELKEITPNVVYIWSDNKDYIKGVEDSIDLAAKLFDKEDKGTELKNTLESKVNELKEKSGKYKNALVTMYNEKKLFGFDAGEDSRFAYVYNDFGFKPATTGIDSSSHGSDFSYESLLKVNPEVLLVIDRTDSEVDVIKKDIENDIVKKTTAYKKGQIVYLDGTNWYFSSIGARTEVDKMQEILDELK